VIVAVLAGIAGVALTTSLGNWQTRRGDEKAARQQQWTTRSRGPGRIRAARMPRRRSQLPQRVQADGTFVAEATVYIDNRIVDGVAGFQVITPLAVAEGMPWILVNRGWAPRNMADRTELPKPLKQRSSAGRRRRRRACAPRARAWCAGGSLRGIWQNLDFDAYEQASDTRWRASSCSRRTTRATAAARLAPARRWCRQTPRLCLPVVRDAALIAD